MSVSRVPDKKALRSTAASDEFTPTAERARPGADHAVGLVRIRCRPVRVVAGPVGDDSD
jgi:hypothetical protein